jgi:hypothetical protein
VLRKNQGERFMEMEMEVKDDLGLAVERLYAAACLLENATERVSSVELHASLERVSERETQLEQRLAEAEAMILTLKAEAAKPSGRRIAAGATLSTGVALSAKEGVAVEAGALDAALKSLSLEQRIAVKSEMMRAGLLG